MTVEYICDGCGKVVPAETGADGRPYKPSSWYERGDKDGTQQACCRECIKKVAEKTGKTDLVMPI